MNDINKDRITATLILHPPNKVIFENGTKLSIRSADLKWKRVKRWMFPVPVPKPIPPRPWKQSQGFFPVEFAGTNPIKVNGAKIIFSWPYSRVQHGTPIFPLDNYIWVLFPLNRWLLQENRRNKKEKGRLSFSFYS